MDATPQDPNSDERFRRLVEPGSEPEAPHDVGGLKHGRPFMERAVFRFGQHEEPSELPPRLAERAPCPLCGEPGQEGHAYCARCGFRLPWAAQAEGLPESEPRRNRLDHAIERATSDAPGALCRFCAAPIAPYDRRCRSCGRWLASSWSQDKLDSWQPDFDAWDFSQVRGFGSGCLSPIVIILTLILWRALT